MGAHQNANFRMGEREMILITGFFAIIAILTYMFPSFAETNSDGQIDWITMPLVGFPIIASGVLMAFASMATRRRKRNIEMPIKLASLFFSLFMLAITTSLFFGILESINWDFSTFNSYELEFSYAWNTTLGVNWHVGMDALSFSMVWLTTLL